MSKRNKLGLKKLITTTDSRKYHKQNVNIIKFWASNYRILLADRRSYPGKRGLYYNTGMIELVEHVQ